MVSKAADTFISTVSFNLAKTDIGEPGKLSFTATDVNGNAVEIDPVVTWTPTNIQECILRHTAAVGAVVQRPLCGLSSGRN